MQITFDGVAGEMRIKSIYRFSGTTTTEGDVPIRRVKYVAYHGPQNAQPAAWGGKHVSDEPPPLITAPPEENGAPAARPR
jgi:hypothetical protein